MADSGRATTSPTHRVPLRVLLVEDSEADAELLLEELRRGGYEPTWERVDTASALTTALGRPRWDVIACDWVMPRFSAPAALAVLQQRHVDVPIIIVSGQVGEEYAVTAMKAGAHDFVSKQNLARLCPAIERELKETEVRRARRQAEEALYLAQFSMDQAGDAILWADQHGRLLYVNDTATRRLGYTREQLLAMNIWDIDPNYPPQGWPGHWDEIKASGVLTFETRHRRQDGTIFPVEVVVKYLQHADREYVCGVSRDITERKRAQEALQQSEERFSSAFEHAAIGMALVGLDGRWLRVNQALCDLTGYSAEELTARTFQDITHPDDLAADLEYVRQLLAGEIRNYHMEKRYFHKRGHAVWILLSVSLVRDARGQPLHFIAQIQDITERRRAEEALRRSEERLRLAQQAAQVVTWDWDLVSGKSLWSSDVTAQLGLPPGTLDGTYEGFLRLIHPEDRDDVRQALARAIADDAEYNVEFRVLMPDGGVRWAASRGHVLRDGSGQTVRMLGVSGDITEHKQAEEALRKSEERYRSLFENMQEGLAYCRMLFADGRAQDFIYLTVNDAFETLTGLKDVEGKRASEVIPGIRESDPQLLVIYGRVALTGKPERFEIYLEALGLWFAISVYCPEREHFVAVFDVVTERKRAEGAMRLQSEIAKNIAEGVYLVSAEDLRIAYANPKMEEMFGYAPGEMNGKHVSIINAPTGGDPVQTAGQIEKALTETGAWRGEVLNIKKDGTPFWGQASISMLHHPEYGNVYVSLQMDISERKQAEEREQLAVAALQLLDRPGNVRSLTGELLRLIKSALDFDAAAIRIRKGEDFPYLVCDGFPEAFVRAENSLLARGCDGVVARDAGGQATLECTCGLVVSGRTDPSQPFFTEGGTFWTNDSSVLLELAPGADPRRNPRNQCIHSGYMSLALIPLRHGEQIMGLLQLNDREMGRFTPGLVHFLEGLGASIGIALSGRQAEQEISRLNADLERRVAERTAQLEVANKELEAFSYSVSHDLRAPLRAVDGFSTLLLDRYGPQVDAQGQHYLQRVRAGAQRMDELINDLLVLSRITRSEMCRRGVDLSTLARTIAADLRKTEPERQVECVIADGVVVEGDAGLLRSALENLLGNAWKYTSKHPTARIEFGVSNEDGQPVYFVRDDGAGFDMAYVDKLFGAFQRLHAAEDFEGTGIGLATVHRIIQRHGGRLWAEGAVEQGATFSFTLPEAAPGASER